jgi:hypothetical protein
MTSVAWFSNQGKSRCKKTKLVLVCQNRPSWFYCCGCKCAGWIGYAGSGGWLGRCYRGFSKSSRSFL